MIKYYLLDFTRIIYMGIFLLGLLHVKHVTGESEKSSDVHETSQHNLTASKIFLDLRHANHQSQKNLGPNSEAEKIALGKWICLEDCPPGGGEYVSTELFFDGEPKDAVVSRGSDVLFDCNPKTITESTESSSGAALYGARDHVIQWRRNGAPIRDVLSETEYSEYLSNRQDKHKHEPRPHYVLFNNGSLLIHSVSGRLQGDDALPGSKTAWEFEAEARLRTDLLARPSYLQQLNSDGSRDLGAAEPRAPVADVDAGFYDCLVSGFGKTRLSRPARLRLQGLGTRFFLGPHPVLASLGSSARFSCLLDGAPSVLYRWELNRQPLPLNDRRYSVLPGGVLQISGVVSTDAGRYRCVAECGTRRRAAAAPRFHPDCNPRPSSEAVLTLVPRSSQKEELFTLGNVTVHQFGDAILECFYTGKSSAVRSYKWVRFDGKAIRAEGVSTVGRGNLLLKNASAADNGTYVCVAEFHDGKTSSSITVLRVLLPPVLRELPMSSKQSLAYTARFSCPIEKGYPEPSIIWLHNGKAITITGRYKQLKKWDLLIAQTELADEGIYQCILENEAGVTSAAARLVITWDESVAPSTPTNVVAKAVSSTAIRVTWNASKSKVGPLLAYSVHYYPTNGGRENNAVSQPTSFLAEGLRPFTNYSLYVQSYVSKSASLKSTVVTCVTGEDVPLGAPRARVEERGSTQLSISWSLLSRTRAQGVIVIHRVFYRSRGQQAQRYVDVGGNETEVAISDLKPKSKYDVRVLAGTKLGFPNLDDSQWPWVTVRTGDVARDDIPVAPKVQLLLINSTSVFLFWAKTTPHRPLHLKTKSSSSTLPPSAENRGFRLSTRLLGSSTESSITLPFDSDRHLFHNLTPSSNYELRLWSFRESVESEKTIRRVLIPDVVFQRFDSVDDRLWPALVPPLIANAESKEATSVLLSLSSLWFSSFASDAKMILSSEAVPLNETDDRRHYRLFFTVRYAQLDYTRAGGSGVISASSWRSVDVTAPSIRVDGLKPFTQYRFSARASLKSLSRQKRSAHAASDSVVEGPFGVAVDVQTLEDLPDAPRQFTARMYRCVGETRSCKVSVKLDWIVSKNRNGRISYLIKYRKTDVERRPPPQKVPPPKMSQGGIVNAGFSRHNDLVALTPDRDVKWESKRVSGFIPATVIEGLEPNQYYEFVIFASNSAGESSPLSEVILTNCVGCTTSSTSEPAPDIGDDILILHPSLPSPPPRQHGQEMGVAIGISIGLCCIAVCVILFLCRNRCFPSPLPPGFYSRPMHPPYNHCAYWEPPIQLHPHGNSVTYPFLLDGFQLHPRLTTQQLASFYNDGLTGYCASSGAERGLRSADEAGEGDESNGSSGVGGDGAEGNAMAMGEAETSLASGCLRRRSGIESDVRCCGRSPPKRWSLLASWLSCFSGGSCRCGVGGCAGRGRRCACRCAGSRRRCGDCGSGSSGVARETFPACGWFYVDGLRADCPLHPSDFSSRYTAALPHAHVQCCTYDLHACDEGCARMRTHSGCVCFDQHPHTSQHHRCVEHTRPLNVEARVNETSVTRGGEGEQNPMKKGTEARSSGSSSGSDSGVQVGGRRQNPAAHITGQGRDDVDAPVGRTSDTVSSEPGHPLRLHHSASNVASSPSSTSTFCRCGGRFVSIDAAARRSREDERRRNAAASSLPRPTSTPALPHPSFSSSSLPRGTSRADVSPGGDDANVPLLAVEGTATSADAGQADRRNASARSSRRKLHDSAGGDDDDDAAHDSINASSQLPKSKDNEGITTTKTSSSPSTRVCNE